MPRIVSLIAALLLSASGGLSTGVAHAAANDLTDVARAHYLAGSEEYRRGDYGEALAEFQKSYEMSRRPELLFNLGMCQAKRGHWREAEGYLRQFLATNPRAEDRVEAQAQLQRLEQLEELERTEAQRVAGLPRRVEGEAPSATPPSPTGSFARRHVASLTTGGAGLAALLVMTVTAVAAEGAFGNADCDPATHLCKSRDSLESAQHLAIASDVLLGIGVAAGASAIVLAILEVRRPRLLAVRPTASGLRVEF